MSCNREGIIWPQADGKWAYGLFSFESTNLGDPDRDPEWDVEYDYSSFGWASGGHPTMDDARASWRGANTGGYSYIEDRSQCERECAGYDQMLEDYRKRERAERAELRAARRAYRVPALRGSW